MVSPNERIPTCPPGTHLAWSATRKYYCAPDVEIREAVAEKVAPPAEIPPPVKPPLAKPPPVVPPIAPPVEVLPIEPIDIIGRVYPKYPTWKPEEIPAFVDELGIRADEDPEAFLYDLQARASEEEVASVLGLLGATPEDIEEIFEGIEEPFIEPPPRVVESIVVELEGIRQIVSRTEDNSLYDRRGNWVGFYDYPSNTIFNPYKAEGLGAKARASFVAGIGDVLSTSGGAARWLGFEDVGSKLSDVATQLQRSGVPASAEFEAGDLLNPEFYATKIVRTIPFALSLAPLAIGGFYGGATIATATGVGTVWTLIVGGLTGAALSRPLESALEAGSQYDDAIARGKTEKEASDEAEEVFRNNMLLIGADAWEIAIALAPTPKWVPTALVKGGLVRTARIGGKMVIVGLSEGGEEIYQDMIQRHARGEEWQLDPISKEVFAIGFVMGMGMGLGGDVITGIVDRSKGKMSPAIRREFDDSVDGFKAVGFLPDQAELRALEVVSETLEGERILTESIEEAKEVPEVVPDILPLEQISKLETRIPIDLIRKDEATEIERLTEEIRREGIAEPITIRVREDGSQIVWDGIHRLIVAQDLGIENVPVRYIGEEGLPAKKPPPPKPKPPVVPEVIEEAPERIVYTEKGIPVPPEETIPQSVADNIPILQDIGAKEKVRPTRKVFERLGLYEVYKGIQKAEVELGEANVAFNKRLKEVSNLVDKDRRNLVFRELENPGTVVGLTFNEKRAVNFFRENFNKWADKLNLPQEKRLKNYVTHIFEADIAEQLKEKHPIDPAIARALEYKAPKTIFNPFLQKRLGATVGLIEDPFAAASAYEARQLKVLYYEPFLEKIATIANDPKQHRTVRDYLKDYSRRMTSVPSKLDIDLNKDIQELVGKIRGLPGGETIANFLSKGNPSGWASYNFTSAIYTLWLGFKPTSAIRNLSQHTLIIGEVGPVNFADGMRMRFTKEGKQALSESLVLRSRKAAFVPGIDDSFATQWVDKFRETALWMFRMADKQNVSDAFLSGYAEAKGLLPEADRQVWIDRGDEVAADTQYLYTKMNSMAISQTAPGRVFSILTTWSENWVELMSKWIARRPSQVYLQHKKVTGVKVTGANWATSYKAILMYMLIIGLGFAIKEKTRLKAWEYTGLTSIRYLADIAGGDFPGLQYIGAAANLVAGFVTDDERRLKSGWNQLNPVKMAGILRQLEAVAKGDKDWLTLLFYLEGRDWKIKQLKDGWEKEFEAYPLFKDKEGEYDINLKLEWMRKHPKQATWSESKIRSQWRIDNPLTEAKMFIVSQFTTLSSDKARAEVLRLIEKHDLNTEFIDGYEKVFGVDTDEELTKFKKRIGMLEKFVVGEEAEYFTVSSFVTEVNRLVKVQGRTKVDRDASPFTLEILRAQDSFVQYDSLEEADARTLFRQQFPDIEALLYLTGQIQSFENPKSAELLLGLMKKYDIPPEGIRAFVEDPARYDELFTQKFELEQKWFDQSTEYENYGNPESPLYIEDKDERAKTRDTFKENNPNWVADMRRVEAIDHDATEEIIESWAERGKTTDEFGAGGSEAKVWLIDNPETFKWALDQELLTDDGSDWNEAALRLNVEMAKLDEESVEYATLKRKKEAHTRGFADFVDDYVSYYDLPVAGYRQERFLLEHPEFAQAMANIKGIEIPTRVPPVEYDILLEKKDRTPQEDFRLDAHRKFVPDSEIENYVTYYSLKKPERLELWYEDDWFLMEHMNFYREVYLKIQGNERADFRQVPTREVYKKYQEYLTIPKGKPRDDYRYDNRDLDKWLVLKWDYVPIAEKKIREKLTPAEKRAPEAAERLEEMREKLKELTE